MNEVLMVACDWCDRKDIAIDTVEIIVVRLRDGSLEPEAWCPWCQEEAAVQGGLGA